MKRLIRVFQQIKALLVTWLTISANNLSLLLLGYVMDKAVTYSIAFASFNVSGVMYPDIFLYPGVNFANNLFYLMVLIATGILFECEI